MFEKWKQLPLPLYFLFTGTTVTRLGSFVFPYLTIYLTESRGYSYETVGIILSVGSLGLLAGNFSGGVLTDQWSRKWTLILALLLNASGFAGLAMHYEYAWCYALFLFVGYLGSGLFTPAANTVIADVAPQSVRPFAYTVNYVCINLGMGLGPLLGGYLATYSYRLVFFGDVLTSLLCAALILYGVSETKVFSQFDIDAGKKIPRVTWNVIRRNQTVVVFCAFYFFLIGPLMGMEFAVPLLVKQEFAASLVYVGMVYTINATCILAFSFLVEKLVRDRDEILMMVLSGILWSLGMSVLLIGYSVTALLSCTVLWTIGEIIASILVPNFIASRVPSAFKGRFMALNDIVRSFAGVVFPIGLGLLWTHQSARSAVLVITLLPVSGAIFYGLLFLSTRREPGKMPGMIKTESQ